MIMAGTMPLAHHHRHCIRRLASNVDPDGYFAATAEGVGERADVELVEAGELALGDGAEDREPAPGAQRIALNRGRRAGQIRQCPSAQKHENPTCTPHEITSRLHKAEGGGCGRRSGSKARA